VFGEITRNDAASCARTNNDNVVGLLGHQRLSVSRHLYRSISTRSRSSAIAVVDSETDWTMLWRVTLQRRQGKSPLAIESIDDCYCRLPRGVMP
jgi:hypothetical protein